MEKPDRPAAPPCPLAYASSEPSATTCEYFRGGSRLNFTGQNGTVQYGPLSAAICINVSGLLTLYMFLNKRVMRGLTAGSVKG